MLLKFEYLTLRFWTVWPQLPPERVQEEMSKIPLCLAEVLCGFYLIYVSKGFITPFTLYLDGLCILLGLFIYLKFFNIYKYLQYKIYCTKINFSYNVNFYVLSAPASLFYIQNKSSSCIHRFQGTPKIFHCTIYHISFYSFCEIERSIIHYHFIDKGRHEWKMDVELSDTFSTVALLPANTSCFLSPDHLSKAR